MDMLDVGKIRATSTNCKMKLSIYGSPFLQLKQPMLTFYEVDVVDVGPTLKSHCL